MAGFFMFLQPKLEAGTVGGDHHWFFVAASLRRSVRLYLTKEQKLSPASTASIDNWI
jgi:hypothetical protein